MIVLQENLGVLRTGEDLLKLLDYGMRGGQNRYFTYVLMGGSLRFSETGAAFLADMMSKHAMHSGCAEQVRGKTGPVDCAGVGGERCRRGAMSAASLASQPNLPPAILLPLSCCPFSFPCSPSCPSASPLLTVSAIPPAILPR